MLPQGQLVINGMPIPFQVSRGVFELYTSVGSLASEFALEKAIIPKEFTYLLREGAEGFTVTYNGVYTSFELNDAYLTSWKLVAETESIYCLVDVTIAGRKKSDD